MDYDIISVRRSCCSGTDVKRLKQKTYHLASHLKITLKLQLWWFIHETFIVLHLLLHLIYVAGPPVAPCTLSGAGNSAVVKPTCSLASWSPWGVKCVLLAVLNRGMGPCGGLLSVKLGTLVTPFWVSHQWWALALHLKLQASWKKAFLFFSSFKKCIVQTAKFIISYCQWKLPVIWKMWNNALA